MIYLYYKDTKTFGLSFSFLLIFKTLRASYLQVGNFSHFTIFEGNLYTSDRRKLISYLSKGEKFIIPDSVTSIGDSALSGCKSLQSVSIPDSVTSIGDSAFSGCSSLHSVNIPDSVTSIGDRAFSYCSSLLSVTIPDSVTSIGDSVFTKDDDLPF